MRKRHISSMQNLFLLQLLVGVDWAVQITPRCAFDGGRLDAWLDPLIPEKGVIEIQQWKLIFWMPTIQAII